MSVDFVNNSVKVKAALDDAVRAYLYEAGGELEAQTKRNMPNGQWYAQQKSAWTYKVDESKAETAVGNPLESSLWTELGTGEYALNKDGRKGYWIYVKNSDGTKSSNPKSYSLADAKKIVAMMRADGLEAYYTKGQTAKRPLYKAFISLKSALIRRAEEVLKARLDE